MVGYHLVEVDAVRLEQMDDFLEADPLERKADSPLVEVGAVLLGQMDGFLRADLLDVVGAVHRME